MVGVKEYMLGLGSAVMTREVDIIEGAGVRCLFPVVIGPPVEMGLSQARERWQSVMGGWQVILPCQLIKICATLLYRHDERAGERRPRCFNNVIHSTCGKI